VIEAPGVAVGCSVLRALEGGEGSIEAVRSWRAGGLADVARGGLHDISVRSRHWMEIEVIATRRATYTDSCFAPSGRSVVI
jgi:hypothetical protein